MSRLAFIGAGSVSEALIAGITGSRLYQPHDILVTNRTSDEHLQTLAERYGVTASRDPELLKTAETVILAVKPKDMAEALESHRFWLKERRLIISVAAGISLAYLRKMIGDEPSLIRAMPNTSAIVRQSLTGMALEEAKRTDDTELAESIFACIGKVFIVSEDQMDAITALTGSGPAFIYFLVEAMIEAGKKLGFTAHEARSLVSYTLYGAGTMLMTLPDDPVTLRERITSPAGTTASGLAVLNEKDVYNALIQAVLAAHARARELGQTNTFTR